MLWSLQCYHTLGTEDRGTLEEKEAGTAVQLASSSHLTEVWGPANPVTASLRPERDKTNGGPALGLLSQGDSGCLKWLEKLTSESQCYCHDGRSKHCPVKPLRASEGTNPGSQLVCLTPHKGVHLTESLFRRWQAHAWWAVCPSKVQCFKVRHCAQKPLKKKKKHE
jgi:hypothetical protein